VHEFGASSFEEVLALQKLTGRCLWWIILKLEGSLEAGDVEAILPWRWKLPVLEPN